MSTYSIRTETVNSFLKWDMYYRVSLAVLSMLLITTSARMLSAQEDIGNSARQEIDPSTRAEILAAREAIWRAYFANDSARLERLLPNAVAAGSGQSWQDRVVIVEASKEFVRRGGKLIGLKFDNTHISLSNNVAVVRSTYNLETQSGSTKNRSGGHATEVFVRENGRWVNPFWYLTWDRSD